MSNEKMPSDKDFHTIVKEIRESIRVVDHLPSYDDDPFFKKKREDAIRALTECPIPEWLLKRVAQQEQEAGH